MKNFILLSFCALGLYQNQNDQMQEKQIAELIKQLDSKGMIKEWERGFRHEQDKIDHSKDCPKDCKPCQEAVEKGIKSIGRLQDISGEIKAEKHAHAIHTALAGLVFIASGSTLEKGEYNGHLKKCKEYLDKWKQDDKKSYGAWRLMYVLLFYTQFQAIHPDDSTKKRIDELAERLVKIQHPKGGWAHHYAPKEDAEYPYSFPSGTIIGLWALYQAKQAGAKIDDKAFDTALEHIKSSTNDEGCIEHGPGAGEDSRNAAKTASGLGIAQLINREKDTEWIKKMTKYVEKNMPEYKGIHKDEHSQVEVLYPFAAITIEKMGKREWLKNLRVSIVGMQDKDGLWRVPPFRRGGDWFEGKTMASAGILLFLISHDSKLLMSKANLTEDKDKKWVKEGKCETGGKCDPAHKLKSARFDCPRCGKNSGPDIPCSSCKICIHCATELGVCTACLKKVN